MKRFKTKKQLTIKTKLIILIISIIFFGIFIFLSLQRLHNNYDNFISFLLSESKLDKMNYPKIKLSKNLDYLFMTYSFSNKDKIVYKEENKKKIYLYNTHNLETYKDGISVYNANIELSNNLKKLGIDTIIETKKTSDYISTGLSYYNISRSFITNIQSDDILYYIDIHRDSVTDSLTIINKKYAKVLFVLGLDNPNYYENKRIMEIMNSYLNNNYPGLSKGILEKQGEGVDGVYNQDLSSNVLLIEIGGEDNTFEEVKNTTEALSLMLYHIINDNSM